MCLPENICACVEVCDCDEMRSVSYALMCVSGRCLCPSGLYGQLWQTAWASLRTHTIHLIKHLSSCARLDEWKSHFVSSIMANYTSG